MDLKQEELLISTFLQSIGPWKEVIVIGGGYALIIYKLYLTNQELDTPPVGTRDIDSLIPVKFLQSQKRTSQSILRKLDLPRYLKIWISPLLRVM